MLKLAVKSDEKAIKNFLKSHCLGVRISCCMEAYGFDNEFCSFWLATDNFGIISAVLCNFDSAVTLCVAPNCNFEELGAFLSGYSFSSLCASSETFERLKLTPRETKNMFVYTHKNLVNADNVQSVCDMKEVYKLISCAIPGSFSADENAYLHFLSDFTYRNRRNLARVKAVCNEKNVISCAMTAAESEDTALISGVACDESARGTGLGKKTVLSLANELSNEKKKVYVIALNDSACGFYQKIGFEKCESVSYL